MKIWRYIYIYIYINSIESLCPSHINFHFEENEYDGLLIVFIYKYRDHNWFTLSVALVKVSFGERGGTYSFFLENVRENAYICIEPWNVLKGTFHGTCMYDQHITSYWFLPKRREYLHAIAFFIFMNLSTSYDFAIDCHLVFFSEI